MDDCYDGNISKAKAVLQKQTDICIFVFYFNVFKSHGRMLKSANDCCKNDLTDMFLYRPSGCLPDFHMKTNEARDVL